MWVTCVRNSHAKKNQIVYINLFKHFLTFLGLNQNLDAQWCMHLKNHHYHMNYLNLDYSHFLP
jgi:hypothetical protein